MAKQQSQGIRIDEQIGALADFDRAGLV